MDELINTIEGIDQQVFLYLNGMHHPVMDSVMAWLSDKLVWIPFYAVLLFFIIRKYRIRSAYILIALALVIAGADQFTSGFMKPFFDRLRPCYEPALEGLVHLVEGCGGRYGFASSHAANTFGLAAFIWLLFKDSWPGTWLIFFWALIVSYSRIYLGVHYPLDIVTGALVGLLIAWVVFRLLDYWFRKRYQCSLQEFA